MNKDLLSFQDFGEKDFREIFRLTGKIKKLQKAGKVYRPLAGKTLGMIFEKSSTRTRLSFEVGIYQLGGLAVCLNSRDLQIGRGETVADTARIISRYLDALMIRTYAQSMLEEFARHATIPIINGLTDLFHPCQILGDLFTIIEKKGRYKGIKIAYVGDGNNVANSWVEAAGKLPFLLTISCPEGYDPDRKILSMARKEAPEGIQICRNPLAAVVDADVIYTDVWASMGQESEQALREKAFKNYQVSKRLLAKAKEDVIIMHCLPAHRGEEITGDVIDGPHSVVMDQAENRLHVQKAVMEILMGGGNR
jgi:ornithine carbamoyltransferase